MNSNRLFCSRLPVLIVLASSPWAWGQVALGTALVRHAPTVIGTVDGSVQQMLPESVTFSGGATITRDLLVPGMPAIRLNGNPTYGSTIDGGGVAAPVSFQITLNGGANVARVVRRTNPIALPIVAAPPAPPGTRSVTISAVGQSVGDFATLRHLTLNGGTGQFAIPPGAYGDFTANGNSGFTLGVAGATQPAIYHFQRLALNGLTQVQVIGPVIVTVAYGFIGNGALGNAANPAWLTLNVYSAGFTLNGGGTLHGFVNVPNGPLIVMGNSQLVGGVTCDELKVNGGGLLRLIYGPSSNRTPVANNNAVSVDEDASVPIALSASDPDADPLTFTRLTSPTNGTISGVAPNLIYSPASNFAGRDSFTFKVNDGQTDSNVAVVSITVRPVNDRPSADVKTVSVAEDTPASVILSGTDVDGDVLTFTVTGQPTHGSLSTSGTHRVYTPAPNYHGPDSFTYVASDGALSSAAAIVSITVTPLNDAPAALSASYSVNEGQSVSFTLNGSDVDGNPLTFHTLSAPSNGTLTGTTPTLTYRPNVNFGGSDSFTFRVFDGQEYSAPASVTINVTDLNFAPIAAAVAATTDEDTPVNIALSATDADGHALTFTVVTPPQNGTLGGISPGTGNVASVVYTPHANFTGSDHFTYKARDLEFADSNIATVTLTVRPINDPPFASSQSAQTDEDTPITLVLTGSDIENSPLTFAILTPPASGTLGAVTSAPNNTATVTFTPAQNFSGASSFTFKTNDGDRDSLPASVSLTVRAVNDSPMVAGQSLTTAEDTPVTITLAGTDVEGSALVFSIVTPPTHGVLGAVVSMSPTTATIVYTPAANYHGFDGFSFKAFDGERDSVPAGVTLTVTPQNDAPVATGQTLTQPQDTIFNFTLAATDPDGDALTYTIVTPPARGTISGPLPNLTYTPQPNDRSTVTLVFTASDGTLTSNQATVTITMTPLNQPPVAAAVPPTTLDEDTTVALALSATDIDGDALTFLIVTQPARGSLGPIIPGPNNTATVAYTPSANYHGSDTFSFKANDNPRDSNVVTVALTIRPINDAPIAAAQSVTTPEETVAAFSLTATDADGDALSYSVITPPTKGTISLTGANVTYTPNLNATGADNFTWRARDTIPADSNVATVSIQITPINDAPVAANLSLQTDEDVPIAVLLSATDVDSTSLTFTVVTPPSRGTLIGTAPNLTYRPATNDSGPYTFTYRANDGEKDSALATVSLTVRPINDAPIANPLTISTGAGSPTAIALTGSDVDSPTLTYAIAALPRNGTVTGTPPNVTYTSSPSFGGFDSFTFTAFDGALTSAPATIQITTGLPPRSRTYTTSADFSSGALVAVSTDVADQISNKTVLSSYDVVWIANSSKGTIIKLDPETGRATGEFLATRDPNITPYPSRIAVDSKGNAWVANMGHSSIVKIGVPENGGWIDRNGNGLIDTSAALGDIRPWTGGDSTAGATDEAILLYVRTSAPGVRHVSIDGDDNVWVAGLGGAWQKFDGRSGALLRTEPSIGRGENGGFNAPNGRIYSAGSEFLIWDSTLPIASLPEDDRVRSHTWASALDSKGNLWTTRDWTSTVIKHAPNGDILGEYYHGEPWAMGIAIDANDHVWIAHSHCGHSVGHLLPDGTFIGNVEVANHGPVEVSIDRRGRIWAVSSTGVVERINPLGGPLGADGVTPIGEVDIKSGNLGGALWTYGRFTGNSFGLASPDGFWTNVYDGVLAGSVWGPIVANGLICNDGQVEIEASLSADGVTFGPSQLLTLSNRTPSGTGRYLRTRVRLISSATGETPILHDLTVGTAGYSPPASPIVWYASAGEDISGNWPDVIQLKGAFCHSLHAFPATPTFSWTKVSGPGTVTFSNPNIARPTAQFSAIGTYVLQVTGTVGNETSTDLVKVVLTPYNRAPYANAGYTTFRADLPPQIWLWGRVRDDGLPAGATVTSTWEKLFGPGTVTFNNPSSPATTASFSAPGVYVLKLKASDGELTGEDITTVWLGLSCIPIAPDGLVAWWQAAGNGDDHIGGNQAFSERGADYGEGRIGGAFRFDGVNDRMRAFASPSLDVGKGSGLTVELWVRPSADRVATIFEYGDLSTRGFSLRQVGSTLEVNFREANGTGHPLSVGGVLPANTWTHVAATYDRTSGEARIFVNGAPRVSQAIGAFSTSTYGDVFMGGASNSTEFFLGLVDEVSVYTRPLYADEITTFITHPAGKRPPVSNVPPIVNAGPDLVGKTANTPVALAGFVTDDGQPTNGVLITRWSKVSGPGTVTFGNSASPATTATFTEGGVYVLKLFADDGGFCSEDLVEVRAGPLYTFDTDASLAAWWTGDQTDLDKVGRVKLERFNGLGFGVGQAADGFLFNGTNHYGRVAAVPAIDIGASSAGLTIEFWTKPLQVGARDTTIVHWGVPGGASGLQVRAYDNGGRNLLVHLRDTAGGERSFELGGVFTDNTWTHIAVTYDRTSGRVRAYRNGVLIHEANVGIFVPRTNLPLMVGANKDAAELYIGTLDELSLYKRVLTLNEVKSIYESGPMGKVPLDNNTPPVIAASADLFAPIPAIPFQLTGTVSDDGRPAGHLVSASWSKVHGPGTVTFSDVGSATTTATFGEPGTYVLRLDANDGLNQTFGKPVVVRVGATGAAIVDPALAAWWPGNGDVREVIRGNHDIEFLPRGPAFAAGQVALGFNFNGTDHYGRTAAHSDLDIGASPAGLTIEFWAKPTQVGTHDSTILHWGVPGGASGLHVREYDNGGRNLLVHLRDTTGTDHAFELGGVFANDTWVHVAITYDRPIGRARVYKNGEIIHEASVGVFTPWTNLPLTFGANYHGGERYIGILDEISLYTRPLSLAEVQVIHSAGANGKALVDGNQPPIVNAGADISSPVTTATLSGSVTDDGKPAGYPLTVTWRKIEGPGTVTFANPGSAATLATFGAPGMYVLRLDASDDLNSTQSDVVVVRAGITEGIEADSSLAAWWPANGDVREVVRGNHDIEFLPRGPAFATGQVATAFTFNGADHYGRTPAHSDLDIGASAAGLTIEFWAKPSQVGTHDSTILHWGDGSAVNGVHVREYDNGGRNLLVHLRDTTGTDHAFELGGVFTNETWVHVAITYDRTTGRARVYKNGVLIHEAFVGIFTPRTNLPLYFGANHHGGERYIGLLDEISLYTRPLTMIEVQAIFGAGVSGKSLLDDNQPPVANAGPDLASPSLSAILNGSVTDDGRPSSGLLAPTWTRVDGPGTVSFGNPNVAATTASFSTSGTYVLRLDASDGLARAQGDTVVVRVGVANSVESDASLAAWWPGNGDVREVVRGNHDIEFLPRGPAFAAGQISLGFAFNGSDHYGRTAAQSNLDIGLSPAGLTVEFWARPTQVGSRDATLLHWGIPGGASGVHVREYDNGGRNLWVNFRDVAGIDHAFEIGGIFTDNTWVHLAITYDRVTGRSQVFRNGVLVYEAALGLFTPNTNLPLTFGANKDAAERFLGTLDEIALYTRPLTMAEVQRIVVAGSSGRAVLDDNQPPVVNAGPDLTSPTATVTLVGTVIDDGRPAANLLTTAWSKIDGPGTVTFADAQAANTTATFSSSGIYVLRFDANDGLNNAVGDTVVVSAGMPNSVSAPSGLVAWWPGNGDTQERVSGNNDIDFLPRGPAYAAGLVSLGFTFNGADHYGRTPAHSALDIGASAAGLSIEFWAKPSQVGTHDSTIMHWGASTGAGGLHVREYDNGGRNLLVHLVDTSGADHAFELGGVFANETWVHVAITYDRVTGRARVYKDAVLIHDANVGVFVPRTNLPLTFGANQHGGERYIGVLDEIALYSRPLTQAEVQSIFGAGTGGKRLINSNSAPTVALIGPASGSAFVVNSPVTFNALASDVDGTIEKVEFFDGASKIGETNTAVPGQPMAFSFVHSSGFLALGRHVITARATDVAGGVSTSSAVLLDVVPVLPVVAVTAPANGATISAATPLTLSATATYTLGAIAMVEFYDGTSKLGGITTPVGGIYSLTIPAGFSGGSHMLTAKAIAVDGAAVTSLPIFVTATTSAPTIALTAPASNATLAANVTFALTANATDSDGTVAKVEFYRDSAKLGEVLSAPYTFNVVAGLPVGTYALTAKATDTSGFSTTSAVVNITVVAYSGPAAVAIVAPADDSRLTQPTTVTGIVASSAITSWTSEYRLKTADGATPEPWLTLASGSTLVGMPAVGGNPAVPGSLGVFDPTSLVNGIYEIQLRLTESTGMIHFAAPIAVVVEGNMKVGAFTLAFEDLKLPVAGIPITVTRTYDSRDLRVGDFGPGWRLALNNIRVQKNRHLGTAWHQTEPLANPPPLFPFFVTPQRERIVTITMPDGETHRFRSGADVRNLNRPGDPDNVSFSIPATRGKLKFYAIGDTTSRLEPLNEANELNDIIYLHGVGEVDLMTGDRADPDADVYNTTRFRLTTSDGTVYVLDELIGLLELRDLHGNTLVLDRDAAKRVTGIRSTQNSASGPITRSIAIVRDATGRVDYIRDPAGRDLDYLYDAQGRLSSFTNRELNVTQFRYEHAPLPNYLTRVIDPRGVSALRSEFDATGKLVKQIDADGKEMIFSRGIDSTGRFEKVKDRLGYETTFYYDERGNVTLKIDPLGAQTVFNYYADSDRAKFEIDHYGNVKSMAYDVAGNVITQTIGARTTEDPSNPSTGYTTRTLYNAHSAPTQMTDADGRVQTFTYDPLTNNLLTHVTGVGGSAPATTNYTYHPDGTIDVMTDALGNTTRHQYDYAFSSPIYPGAVKQVTVTVIDPAGAVGSDPSNVTATVLRVTRTLFDAQENQLAQIVPRTLPDGSGEDVITRYRYDAENRIKATVLPDGRVTETRYTSFGKEDKTVLWKSVADYETRNDALGRVTSYAYDSRGNQVSITHADGATEASQFDLENRKTWTQDRRGYRTFFVYDSVGRLRFTIHPDGNDGVGASAPTSPVDSKLADNPRTEAVYDLIGRVTDNYDELRRRTRTVYFAEGTPDAGRRKETIGLRSAGNLTTSFQYDKTGNVRFVTDPRGNTTETRYDEQGRPRMMVLPATDEHPATQTETKYDPSGRRVETIDQEGKLTRHRYDALGRLIEVRQYLDQALAASDSEFQLSNSRAEILSTRYTYDALGYQQTQTDALGRVTTYWTDQLGRRMQRILPKDASEPAHLRETLQYDAWGNLWKRADFAGRTTTFAYDALNRLKSKTADPGHPSLSYSHAIARVEFDYNPNGARNAARTFNASNTPLYTEITPRDERGRIDYKDTAGGRLDYSYYANNRLKDVVSSNANGVNIGYRYDEVNRLESVDDVSTGTARTTSYAYNANGSLETVTQPNAVVHTYGYDALNRLRALIVSRGTTLLHTYEYKVRPSGHRRQVVEAAKTTTYTYDDLYRLTGESIAGDPRGNSGDISYSLDKVGNRLARASQVSTLGSQANQTYNARDWLNGDTYTANGSTQSSAQLAAINPQIAGTDTYDFEERLIVRARADGSTVNVTYDPDGHRVAKNILGAAAQPIASTTWLVDTNNLTGYAQVFEERTAQIANPTSQTTKVYTYGSDLISQSTSLNGQPAATHYFAYDGHGSTRELTDANGTVSDRFDYEAFGNLIFRAGATANAYLYCGEQLDSDLGLYYLRARYLNVDGGRFWSMDPFEGRQMEPRSLQKYIYANANSISNNDPSGNFSLTEIHQASFAVSIVARIVVPAIVNRFSSSIAFNIVRGAFAAERTLLWLEVGTAIAGGTLFIADGVDRMAENLLQNSELIEDGHFPASGVRGNQVERIANPNLGGTVSIIDDLDDGIGTSIKSRGLDGGEPEYLRQIHQDARDVAKAPQSRIYGTTKNGQFINLRPGAVRQPALLVGVPQNHSRMLLSPTFKAALENYRMAYGVVIRVVPVRGWIRR
jgi:RHS repeat-associated protein